MGRKPEGSTPRAKPISLRLNSAELELLEERKRARGITETSTYFRTLMREDAPDEA